MYIYLHGLNQFFLLKSFITEAANISLHGILTSLVEVRARIQKVSRKLDFWGQNKVFFDLFAYIFASSALNFYLKKKKKNV